MALEIGGGITIGGNITVTIETSGANAPGAPTIGTATATGATTATVAFTAPANDGGATITSYTATSSPGNITGILSQAGSGTITVTGLSQGTNYTFTVTATNAAGTSSPSAASNSITTFATPVNTVAPVVSGTATVGQTLSSTTGTWTGTATITYTYQWQRNEVNIGSATSSTYTLVDADASNPIRCVVTGTNSYGNSSANSNATSNVAAIAPGAPTIGTATTTGTTTATVAFTAPASNGGATITTYTATSSPGGITGTLSQAGSGTINMTGLTQGTSYTFTVTATNSAGTGSASSASNSITTFATPVNTVAPVVSGTATVGQVLSTTNGTWTGTATITYTYQWQRNEVNIGSATSSTYTLVDADAGNPIRCVVTGTNSYGNSSANSNATANVSAIVPGAPTIGTATATGDSTATVAFTAPASNGGATITSYTATSSPAGGTGTLSQAGSGTISVTGLTQGTTYTFTVTATNSVGTGSASSASNSITTTASYFNYNTLLLPGASTTFVDDASTNNFAVTINGDTKPNSLNPYTPGYYGTDYNGSNSWIETSAISSAFNFYQTSYTMEGWFFFRTMPANGTYLFSLKGVQDIAWYFNGTNGKIDMTYVGSSGQSISNDGAVTAGSWKHIAICQSYVSSSSGTMTVYVNGIASGSYTGNYASLYTGNANLIFGIGDIHNGYSNPTLNMIASNIRVIKGQALFTGNFTPSTSPLTTSSVGHTGAGAASTITGTVSLLTCQSNRLIDNSSNAFTLTGSPPPITSFQPFTPNSSYSTYGSGYFDGTGDYLSTPNNIAFGFGTGDYTMEAWIYTPTGQNGGRLFETLSNSDNIDIDTSTGTVNYYNGSVSTTSAGGLVNQNTWSHIALVRLSGTARVYVNGVLAVTQASTPNSSSRILYIGGITNNFFAGYINNVRVVKGTAVYTANFTPPTAPLTAISGTSLLTLQNNQSVNNNVFLDNSSNNLLVTRNGNTTQGTFSPYGGNWSNYFDGSGDYLSIANSTAFDLPGDFTIQCWLNLNVTVNQNIIAKWWTGGQQWVLQFRQAGQDSIANQHWRFYANNGSTAATDFTEASTTSVAVSTWYHIALTRSGSSYKFFRNGAQIGSTYTNAAAITSTTDPLTIGQFLNSGVDFYNGYISNLQIVKGTALYTSAFTPPTTPLTPITNTSLLTCADGRFIDDSINNFTVTNNGNTSVQRFSPFNPSSLTPTSYSGYFDGTGDYLTVPFNSAFNLGSGDFTIEFWVNTTSTAAYATALRLGDAWTTGSWALYLNDSGGSGVPSWWSFTLSNVLSTSGAAVNDGAWHHIALVRNSATMTMYIDGTSRGTLSVSTSSIGDTSTSLWIARDSSNVRELAGYLSNIRIVKGTALYTSNFTPSTTPLTTTSQGATASQVSLLTLQSPTIVDNSTNNFTISTFGNSQPLTQNPFGYTSATTQGYTVSTIGGSGYFDGTGDYLTIASSTSLTIGTSSATVEFWIYPTNITGYQRIITATLGAFGAGLFMIRFNNGTFLAGNTGGGAIESATLPTLNAWNHVAWVGVGGASQTLYINGINVGTSSSYNLTTPIQWIGGFYTVGGDEYTNGYISDVRINKGTAVYKSNFVPSSAPLTAVQNTTFLTNMTSGGIIDYTMMTNSETVGNASLSTTVTKFGATSLYFDGTGDYLRTPTTQTLALGSGNFTVELWVNMVSNDINQTILDQRPDGSHGAYPAILFESRYIRWYVSSATQIQSTSQLSFNTWYHVAICRSAGVTKMFIDGVQSGSSWSDSTNYLIGANGQTIGASTWYGGTANINGYLDDVRVTKGYAYYTSNFTPPTAPFPTY